MIIVSGHVHVAPDRRDAFIDSSHDAMVQARGAPGCRDFVVAADPLDPGRVNVYEESDSSEELEAFRGAGPEPELAIVIVEADVRRHEIASSGPA